MSENEFELFVFDNDAKVFKNNLFLKEESISNINEDLFKIPETQLFESKIFSSNDENNFANSFFKSSPIP